MALHPRPLLVERDDLSACLFKLLPSIEGDEPCPAVASLFADLSDVLLYGEPGGERSIKLIPMSFKVAGFYRDTVGEMILDLGGERVEADHPVFCCLARLSAALVDDQSYSTDFRLDSLDALDRVLAGLKRATDDEEE
jgi:hypothetical protein